MVQGWGGKETHVLRTENTEEHILEELNDWQQSYLLMGAVRNEPAQQRAEPRHSGTSKPLQLTAEFGTLNPKP